MAIDLQEALQKTQIALAEEILVNPDHSWKDSLIDRFRKLLRDNDQSDAVEPIESWPEGSIALTEAIVRSAGYRHGGP